MKKIFSLLISFLLIFPQAVFAENNDALAKALSIVKSRASVSDSFDGFQSSSYKSETNETFSFMWQNTETGENLEVSCTDKGIITSYYNYVPEHISSGKPSFNDNLYEKAKETASAFLKKINPDIYDKISFSERENIQNIYNNNYSFDFHILENGLKVNTNTGYISLNSASDRVTSFNLSYNKAEFVSPEKIISKYDAISAYKKNIGLKLVYKMAKINNDIKIYPCYIENNSDSKYIDAFSGELFVPSLDDAYPINAKLANASAAGGAKEEATMDMGFSEIEIKELDKVSGLISKIDAEKIIRENKIINLPKDLTLNNISLTRDYYDNEKFIYSLNFYNDKAKDITEQRVLRSLRATVDAKTGDIISFYKYYTNEKEIAEKDKLNISKASEIAEKTLTALGNKNKADFKLNTENESPYNYTYTREVNGVPFISANVNISLNQKTGEVISWSISDYDFDFPSLDNVLSVDDVTDKLFSQVTFEPIYILSYDRDSKKYSSNLVYTITDNYSVNLNAETGKLINSRGEDMDAYDNKLSYTDLDGHYAKDKIEKLASYGISILSQSAFNPEKEITEEEFLAYMLMAFEGETNLPLETKEDINYVYKRAIRLGYLQDSEKSEGSPLSRLKAIKIIVKALGYDEIAKINNIFISPFKDITDDNGYLSIIYGLNIAKGDGNGFFYPNKNITKAETAVMVYNYLNR